MGNFFLADVRDGLGPYLAIYLLVNPVIESRKAWSEIATRSGAPLVNIQVVCSDKHEHPRRVETRKIDIPGLTPPTWQSVLDYECRIETAVAGAVLPVPASFSYRSIPTLTHCLEWPYSRHSALQSSPSVIREIQRTTITLVLECGRCVGWTLTMHYPKDHLVVCRAQFREAPFQKIRYFRLPTACGAPFWPESIRITSIGSSCLTIQRG